MPTRRSDGAPEHGHASEATDDGRHTRKTFMKPCLREHSIAALTPCSRAGPYNNAAGERSEPRAYHNKPRPQQRSFSSA